MDSLLLLRVAVLVLFGLTSGLKSSEESGTWNELEKSRSCPPWFIPDHDNNCTCGSSLNVPLLSYSCGWRGELGSLGKASALQYIKLCFQHPLIVH